MLFRSYLTRPLTLKSHITLELREGAKLLGWTKREDYPIDPAFVTDTKGNEIHLGGFEGNAVPMYRSLITAQYAENITIVGPGTVDGNAPNTDFWTDFHSFPAARPRALFFNRCKNITVHGVHVCNSPPGRFIPITPNTSAFMT